MSRYLSIRNFMLRALNEMDGVPMPQQSLFDSVQLVIRPRPSDTECTDVLRKLERDRAIAGVRDEAIGDTTWLLTNTGQHLVPR